MKPQLRLKGGVPLLHGSDRATFLAIHADSEDDFVERLLRLLQDRKVSKVEWIEASRIDGDARREPMEKLDALEGAATMLRKLCRPGLKELGPRVPVAGPGGPLILSKDGTLV